MEHIFYKENGTWYIDLPAFLEAGLGTKANLMMVAGADTLLDILSNYTDKVKIEINNVPFEGYTDTLIRTAIGKDQNLLDSIGHPYVEYGAYYTDITRNHKLWLCPVTEYVLGQYPEKVYIAVKDPN